MAFQWVFDKAKLEEVAILVGSKAKNLKFPIMIDNTLNSTAKYLQLDYRGGNLVIALDDLRARAEGADNLLGEERNAGWFKCKLWKPDGTELTKAECLLNSQSLRTRYPQLIKLVLRHDQKYTRELWSDYFYSAIVCAQDWRKSQHPNVYDVVERFFVPENETKLYFFFDQQQFSREQAMAFLSELADKHQLGKVIPCWLEENPEVKGTKELVKLSTHLLGFYSTWVDKMTLEQIVFEQTGEYTWIREPTPTFDQVEAFNEDLQAVHSKVSPFKHDSIPGKIEVSGDRWHNDAFAKAPRRGTKTIMGESANKWAQDTLKWKEATGIEEEKVVSAEWLHRVAHRFEPTNPDRYSNMIFGTKECNTSMIRAESVVTQLLKSNIIKELRISTLTIHDSPTVQMLDACRQLQDNGTYTFDVNWVKNVDPSKPLLYCRWIASEMVYQIKFTIRKEDSEIYQSPTTVFYPFSRQRPFRYEYDLDQRVLQHYLGSIQLSEPNDTPQLFKDYKIDYSNTDSEDSE